ncbi:n19m, NADH-ubiquinone oxidoreductase 9.5 kDa subunit [Rhodotorula toruloides]
MSTPNVFRRTYSFLQRSAHEQPAIFYSLALGAVGPILVVTVPPIRKRYFGYKPAERIPQSYPLPSRPRQATEGYEDGWELKA